MIFTAVFVVAVLAAIYFTSSFWIRWWWFESLGFTQALTARYISGAVAFLVALVIVGGIFAANWNIALRRRSVAGRSARVAQSRFLRIPLWILTVLLGAVAGVLAAQHWVTWRMALVGNQFGVADPIYGLDAGFYVFRLPALELAHRGLLATLAASLVIVLLLYLGQRGLDRIDNLGANPQMRRHLLVLAALCILLFGLGYLIENFNLLYSTRGFVSGPGFTDVTVVRPLNFILVILSVVAALVLVFSRRMDQLRPLVLIFGGWLAAVGLNYAIPEVVQQTIVEPNQLQRELPYIANNIAFTRSGFGLDNVEQRTLSGQGEPPASALQADSPVLRNVRLWDYRVARQVYQQLQSFVPYYRFNDADVDRYPEADELQQVLVAARELDTNGLQANAQTWTNQHLVYTHGYAAVVSPINEATSQGLPVFTVSGIPPNPAGVMTIERPEIYFGEIDRTWVAVNTGVQEVSGIPGDTPPDPYSGKAQGSIALDNYLRRVMLAIYLGDRRIIFTDELQPESKVLLTRSVMERVSEITPFLRLDGDPYLTIVDGRLIWVIDAYTATDRYPYSTSYDGINYARNTFKVTVDAYDGTVTYYRTALEDPLADAYMEVFPHLFQPISAAPPQLAEHFRYPEELFDIQTEVFSSYHVTDPTAFYNGEDRWQIATEQVETEDGLTEERPMEAYFMTLPLPGETETGFKLIRPFTPINRPNMTAWMAAQGDNQGTARLVVYRFPRQTTVFGPQQVEARIDQDPEISSQFTLLSQAGSRVIRGNLLVIPVEQTVMYVQPVYLQATGTGGAPTELQFVIVATNLQVEMRPTLEEALQAVIAGQGAEPPDATNANVEAGPAPNVSTTVLSGTTAADALAAYQRGQDALQRGDWEGYGQAQRDLEQILVNLAGTPVASSAPAMPEPAASPVPQATPVP
jgi:uncharacterized membrane protein (UPF0182 family)